MNMSRRFRRIMNDRKPGYTENDDDKKACRQALILETNLTGKRPSNIFSLPGPMGHCVATFRAEWPAARIVCVDKSSTAARITSAHGMDRRIGKSMFDNEIFANTLTSYAKKQFPLVRIDRDGNKFFLVNFDFPQFNMMFLDTTNNFDNHKEFQAIIDMINNHSAAEAIVGVTMVAGTLKPEYNARQLGERLCCNLVQKWRVTLASNYGANPHMIFCILKGEIP